MASSLSFPRATFAKLSPHPFLLANLDPTSPDVPPTRTNGRSPDEARTPQVNVSSLSHAHGSAVVRTGDTTVICGVRGEVLPVSSIPQHRPSRGEEKESGDDDESEEGGDQDDEEDEQLMRAYDLLVPNIELATGCAPQFLPGVPPTTAAQTMSTRVYELLHSCRVLRTRDLRIWHTPAPLDEADADADANAAQQRPEVVAYWTLYIDLLFVSYDGNPFDAAWAAVLAALRDTRLPRARWDADREAVVCSPTERSALRVSGLPIACSAAVFLEKEHGLAAAAGGEGKYWVLVDPDRAEEKLCREGVSIVVDRSGGETRLRALSKVGGTVLGPVHLRDLTRVAERRWEEFRKVMG